jgi:crotonobetainyl-CoA:carnitine CoA-transferase CaiB-like acyl-CoA transferase
MAGPMDGIRVVEMGFWVAGPSAAGILADWGADVVKIEPPAGDPFRGLFSSLGIDANPPFELDNRGKRSIALNLDSEEGRSIAGQLVDRADVFISNMRPAALERIGFDPETLRARNRRLVYASVTGYGLAGPDRDRAAYDVGAFWSRSGVVAALSPDGVVPAYQRGGMGDHMAGLAAAGAVSAALLSRERTGEGQLVATSLMRIGAYMMGWDLNINLRLGVPTVPMSRAAPPNPLINCYRCKDDTWLWLLGLEGDRHWPDVIKAIERPDLLEDDRFSDLMLRLQHAAELVAVLDEVFATRTRDDWGIALDRENMWWAPIQGTHDLLNDPQAEGAGIFVEVPTADGSARMVSTPVDFSDTAWAPTGTSPELGQHTEEVLLELGYEWERIAELAGEGVIP